MRKITAQGSRYYKKGNDKSRRNLVREKIKTNKNDDI